VSLPPFAFVSAAPLSGTAKTHEYHIAAASSLCGKTQVKQGDGSSIFVFSREWRDSRRSTTTDRLANPAAGLLLRDTNNAVVVDLEHKSFVDNQVGDPYAACNVEVNPGIYRLTLRAGADLAVSQTIVASPGWQTQVFLLPTTINGQRVPDLTRAAVLVARQNQGFDSNDRGFRLAELARLGLVNERKVLSTELRSMLRDKFENPILGIYAGHLLLLDASPDLQLLNVVVMNLRALVGDRHPDVEALALRVKPGPYRFEQPPMLRRSWALVLAASLETPDLAPPGSGAVDAARRMWGDGAWFTWNDAVDESRVEHTMARALRSQVRPSLEQPTATASPFAAIERQRTTQQAMRSPFESAKRAPARPPASPERKIAQLVHTLGIPRSSVESMLKTINLEENDNGTDE